MKVLINFFKEAWGELKLVSWLTVPQMLASTWLVIALVFVMAIYIVSVDWILARIISFLV
jgi:preprotein translocase SecE subunit